MGTRVLEVILFWVNLMPFDNYCFNKYLVSEFYESDAPKAPPTSMKRTNDLVYKCDGLNKNPFHRLVYLSTCFLSTVWIGYVTSQMWRLAGGVTLLGEDFESLQPCLTFSLLYLLPMCAAEGWPLSSLLLHPCLLCLCGHLALWNQKLKQTLS